MLLFNATFKGKALWAGGGLNGRVLSQIFLETLIWVS